ncbi:MAG: hypothetical protein JNL42_04265, partial [Anaerolineae bacterium]|nr:hypothetical protein [Anaerolineae bacterium]
DGVAKGDLVALVGGVVDDAQGVQVNVGHGSILAVMVYAADFTAVRREADV